MAAMADVGLDDAAAAVKPKSDVPVWKEEQAKCRDFIEKYRTPDLPGKGNGNLNYLHRVFEISRKQARELVISLDDIVAHGDATLAGNIEANATRYVELFSRAVDDILKTSELDDGIQAGEDADDIQRYHYKRQLANLMEQRDGEAPDEAEVNKQLAPDMLRRYELRLAPRSAEKPLSLRQVTATSIGRLVSVKAMVLRVTDVKPLMKVATYCCDHCGYTLYQEVKGPSFMPMQQCMSKQCAANGSKGRVFMQTRLCKFQPYQEIKIQELPEHVPVGNIPRTMTVVARGKATRQVKAGEEVILGGIFLPTPYTGYQAIKAGLTTNTYLDAQTLACTKRHEEAGLDDEAIRAIEEVSESDPYSLLSRSIAPEIFGHEDVKKALLLQLVGGETRQQGDGMKTRGDINICLMGDPGVAKSQLLKHIYKVGGRVVYTTGKGSSDVGLTAAVVKDAMTGELTLEGGALVLADRGICCIDEFDKMEEKDRTAIHEVMEQQTVSIAKAGISTTLNARTAILAAANPRYGRYNRHADKDAHANLMKNINLPAALLSRFDLMFLLLDESDTAADKALAEHITYVHKNEEHPPLDFRPFDPSFLRQYVAVMRQLKPFVPVELRDYIVEAYVDIRARDKEASAKTHSRATTTARQLLSILRLAEAHAKLHARERVLQADVDEAIRLIQMSKASVTENDSDAGRAGRVDPVSRIWQLLNDRLQTAPYFLGFEDAKGLALRAGFTAADFEACIAEYESLDIVTVNPSRTRIDLVAV